jgi:hypothetical protein
MEEGAARECQEEALANVAITGPLLIADVVPAHQIHVFFRARLVGSFGVGPESLESRLVTPAEIPWDELSFPSTREALKAWLGDREAGREDLHRLALHRRFT